jgi:SAM-dependent methyltransferase
MQSLAAALTSDGIAVAKESPRPVKSGTLFVELRCPICHTDLGAVPYGSLAQSRSPIECNRCHMRIPQRNGIWLSLSLDRQAYYARFVHDYELVRRAEGRGSDDSNFYLSLPFCDRTQRNSWQWVIRSRTYRRIERKILPGLQQAASRPLAILDLGAGNAWLSYRLATLGHRPIAVDLQCNAFDGLGAAIHYQSALPSLFPRFQAELDRLPFADAQFDCAIFNASFHYSENYDHTLSEAIRCLRPGGMVIIADTPFYHREASGLAMLEERRGYFQERFGFKSNSLASGEYLTSDRLLALEARHDLQWNTHTVWYGLQWACRPLVARFRGKREPSRFRIYTAQVKTP